MASSGSPKEDGTVQSLYDKVRIGSTNLRWSEIAAGFQADSSIDDVAKVAHRVKLTDVVKVPQIVSLLAKASETHFDQIYLSDERRSEAVVSLFRAQGELERNALIRLRDEGFLSQFFVIDGYDLSWLLESDGRVQQTRLQQWEYDAVSGDISLFHHTHWLWTSLLKKGINSDFIGRMARPVGFTAFSFGMYREAVVCAQYGIEFARERMKASNASPYQLGLRIANLHVLLAVASGRLGDVDSANDYFVLASEFAERAVEAHRETGFEINELDYDKSILGISREQLRTQCHLALDNLASVISDNSHAIVALTEYGFDRETTLAHSAIFAKRIGNSFLELPINSDTAARTVLLFADRTQENLDEVERHLIHGYRLLEDDRFRGKAEGTVLTKDCLDTTNILLCLIRGDRVKAKQVYQSFKTNFAPGERRLSRRRYQAITKLLAD